MHVIASNVYYYKCDITDTQELRECATKIRKDLGAPTIVVANAGIVRGETLLDASERDIRL
jgi:all-trans-retinol dehydrogenase (NAD+)